MDKILFGEWLRKQREERGLSQSDLARLSGLHRQIINKTENGVSDPALKTYIALSNALKIHLMTVLRVASEIPEGHENEAKFEDWEYLISKMTPDDEKELKKIAELKIELRQASEQIERAKNFMQGKVEK